MRSFTIRNLLKLVTASILSLTMSSCAQEPAPAQTPNFVGAWQSVSAVTHPILKERYRFASLVFKDDHNGHYRMEITDEGESRPHTVTLDFHYTYKNGRIYYLSKSTVKMLRTQMHMSEEEIMSESKIMPVRLKDHDHMEVVYYDMKMLLKRK